MDRLLEELHKPSSPNFHRWLKPEEYADRFGASVADVAKLRAWLESEGFSLRYLSKSRSYLTVSGPVSSVRRAFKTELHRFEVDGRRHFSHTGIPEVPEAFASMVLDIEGLHDFLPQSQIRQRSLPLPETTNSSGAHYLSPDDFAQIYNLKPAYENGIDGSGQKIVIVGQSTIDLRDMQSFRKRYNLPANDPEQILYAGSPNPGVTSSQEEANLDLQWAAAVARNAKIYYVYGRSAFSAVAYAVEQNYAPIISASFSGGCEASNSFATLASLRLLAQQANVQGITWVNSSGDAGPAGCDANGTAIAQNGLSLRIPSSTPEITSVGGTELNDRGGTYWRSTNDANLASALSYIPEVPWNESAATNRLLAGGGGISNFHPRPPWQAGPGVGTELYRKSPDVAFAASSYNGYYVIYQGTGYIFSGTSASAPAFAGILALVLQTTGQNGLGNANRLLYPLAQTNPEVFHDVATGDTFMPCSQDAPDCRNGKMGYAAGAGYDMSTGLGSVDVAKLLAAWPQQNAAKSLITLSSSKDPVYAQPDTSGLIWTYTLTLKEHAGVAAEIRYFRINGEDNTSQIRSFFGSSTLPANGALSTGLSARGLSAPLVRTYEIGGTDANGADWTQTLYLPFYPLPVTPTIGGVANGASFSQSVAPGGVLSVFGANLAERTQAAAAVPLLTFMGAISATINGVSAPFYYVSPSQVNLQIPFTTAPGTAELILGFLQGNAARYTFNVQSVAPGIFTDGNRFTVPQTSCGRGETCILFITGQGAVSPALATGAAPSANSSIANLPKPMAPVSMTIGEVPARIEFAGIPPSLVGVMQLNFTVAANTPSGTQQVIVKVGNTESAAAKINVN